MVAKSEKIKAKHRRNTEYNKKVNQRLESMEGRFPSKSWFLQKKPAQTKVNYDHTTGLCKDCHMSQVNYETVLKYAQSLCLCKTNDCPNWTCLCGEEDDCSCNPTCLYSIFKQNIPLYPKMSKLQC